MKPLRLRREGIHWVESDGEIVALDDQRLQYLSANPTGAVLWEALSAGATREELIDRLLAEFDVERAVATGDVDGFLGELSRLGLLEP